MSHQVNNGWQEKEIIVRYCQNAVCLSLWSSHDLRLPLNLLLCVMCVLGEVRKRGSSERFWKPKELVSLIYVFRDRSKVKYCKTFYYGCDKWTLILFLKESCPDLCTLLLPQSSHSEGCILILKTLWLPQTDRSLMFLLSRWSSGSFSKVIKEFI